jgi:hypothetical protein
VPSSRFIGQKQRSKSVKEICGYATHFATVLAEVGGGGERLAVELEEEGTGVH